MEDYQFSFEKLEVWKSTRQFINKIYTLTENYPTSEKQELVSQMRRAAVGMSYNIAGGSSGFSLKDQIRLIEKAYALSLEVYCQLVTSLDLSYITESEFEEFSASLKLITTDLTSLKNSRLKRLS